MDRGKERWKIVCSIKSRERENPISISMEVHCVECNYKNINENSEDWDSKISFRGLFIKQFKFALGKVRQRWSEMEFIMDRI